ncbi:MAG: hypothetical protein WC890_01240 [Candidatus Margulisiibacteriota bacterium]
MKIKLVLIALVMLVLPTITLADDISIDFKPVQGQPYWASSQINADSAELNTLIISLSAKENGTARIFWVNNYDPQFNQIKSLWFKIKKGDHTYSFNIASQNQGWIGWTKGFILFPEMDPAAISLPQAKLVSGNLLTNIQSGWQEFFGPYGRNIVGYTINTMPSPTLFGRSIYVYIYWLIGLSLLLFFANYFILLIKAKKKKPAYGALIKKLLLVITCFWLILEASTLISNWNNLQSDLPLIGKDIETKRAMVNQGDFYAFIQFCEQKLPVAVSFDHRFGKIYDDIKAVYYLYPHEYQKGAEYLLVYDAPAEKEINLYYQPFAKMRENAYILIKRK